MKTPAYIQLVEKTQKKQKENQIIIWLDLKNDREKQYYKNLQNNTKRKKIKIIIFNDLKQLITFLKYFFKLRPSYKTKVTDIFRLIIENQVITKWNGLYCNTRASEILLKWLNNVGTRVPALIFHKDKISIDKII